MGKILTTRDIDVSKVVVSKKLKQVTTKNIEVEYIDKDAPPEAPTGPLITTHNIEKFQKLTKKKAKKKRKK